MLTFVFDLSPSCNATYMHLEVSCPDRELLNLTGWAMNQDMVRGAILGNVMGKLEPGKHTLRCVSARAWQETLNEYTELKNALEFSSPTFPADMEVKIHTLEPNHIVVRYSIEESRVAEWRPELFAS